jgi:RNA polymerase sigma-70 factor (ECF subfamily)
MNVLLHRQVTGAAELSDGEIVRRVVDGEKELFELLLRRYNQRLYRVARGLVSDDSEAQDVLQDSWVRAFEHLAAFRGEAALSTWLARIVVHEAYARLRRGRRFRPLEPALAERLATRPSEAPESTAIVAELRGALESAVGSLAPPYRSVFLLREIEGLSTAETAAALELSSEAVKVRLHRGKAELRQLLDRRFGAAARTLFSFDGARCDRIVGAVFARLAS